MEVLLRLGPGQMKLCKDVWGYDIEGYDSVTVYIPQLAL